MKNLLLSLPIFLQAVSYTPLDSDQDVRKMISFMTDPVKKSGASYVGTAGSLKNCILPLSYYSTADYWGKYVGGLPGNNCTVVDVYNPNDYTLTPSPQSPGVDLQVERVNVYNGIDIYDGGTWQIGLALAAKAGVKGPKGASLFSIANNQNQLLLLGYDGNASNIPAMGANRATSHDDGTFTYNGKMILQPSQAYYFRMVPRNWLSTDPFKDTKYAHYVTATGLPPNPDYQVGKITWMDWKPITGENAWAFLIGPLQLAWLEHDGKVPLNCTAVQNALQVLYAFRCMQSPIGAVYYATKGSLGNTGNKPVDPFEVSVENNASLLSGLLLFQEILKHYPNDPTAKTALQEINVMIHGGGPTPRGYPTQGLLSFFQKYAVDGQNGIFYQGGLANDPAYPSVWVPTREPKAVDVNTWSLSVIGAPLFDSWFGVGAAYNVWQNVKEWGGFYGPDGTLWGVCYSNQDNHGVLSAEWTAGAINLVRILMAQYEAACEHTYVASLAKDEKSMVKHLTSLRTDHYAKEKAFDGVRPLDYSHLVPMPSDKLAYLYASKRYDIPFGWFANPLPSTTSTAWAIMLHYNYNPFQLGGSYVNNQLLQAPHQR